MASEYFPLKPLGELTNIFDSLRIPVKKADRKSGPYPYYGASGIVDHVDSYIFDGDYLLVAEDGENLRSKNLPIAFMAHDKFWVNNHAHILKGKNGNDTIYLCYALKTADIDSYLSGSTRPKLNQGDMKRILVSCPEPEEQHVIAHILGSLDDKIKLNHSMNKTLEAMARAIFKSWFVDFDPVHAKAEGRPTGLPDDIAALFPDSFEESKMGKTPKGWKVKRLNQIADFFNGLACQKYPPKEGEKSLPVIKIRELRQGITENTDKAASDVPGSYIVEDGDVLFSWSGSLLLDIWTQGRGVLNQHIFKVTSENYPKWLCYYWTNYHLTEFQRIAADKATTMGHIKRKHLNDANCCVADKKIIRKADEQIAPLFMLRIQNELEAKQLASLRDTLLPKLISGELRVPDAEKLVEKVGLQQVSLEQ